MEDQDDKIAIAAYLRGLFTRIHPSHKFLIRLDGDTPRVVVKLDPGSVYYKVDNEYHWVARYCEDIFDGPCCWRILFNGPADLMSEDSLIKQIRRVDIMEERC